MEEIGSLAVTVLKKKRFYSIAPTCRSTSWAAHPTSTESKVANLSVGFEGNANMLDTAPRSAFDIFHIIWLNQSCFPSANSPQDPSHLPTHLTLSSCSFSLSLENRHKQKTRSTWANRHFKSAKRKFKTNERQKKKNHASTKQHETKSLQKYHWVCFVLTSFS